MDLISFESLIALVTLTSLEIVLGIDNIVFIAILSGKLDPRFQDKARRLGLFLAMFSRIALLLGIAWIMRLTAPLFEVLAHEVSGRDLILLGGGIFLIAKATFEIHEKLEGSVIEAEAKKLHASFASVIAQIVTLDIIFSLDSVITAVGMARHLEIMIAAIVAAVSVMLLFAGAVSRFITRHPTIQMLALSFLLLIGVLLVAESLGKHIDRGYIYFAMAFSLFVEILNLKARKAARKAPAAHG